MSSDAPLPADDTKPAAAPPVRPAPPTRIRLFGVAALAALGAGGYLYWKLQQQGTPSPVPAAYETAEPSAALTAPRDEAPPPASAPAADDGSDIPAATTAETEAPPTAPDSEADVALPGIDPLAATDEAPSAAAADESAALPDSGPTVPERALAERLAELEGTVAALARSAGSGASEAGVLTIAQAGDLVALAEQRLQLARDTNGAMAALRLAISRLASGEFPAQRRALLADLAALEAFRDVDVAALSAELADLARAAPGLRVSGPPPLAPVAAPAVEDWRSLLAAVWRSLRGLVEVRDADDVRDPLLHPAQTALLRQQLALDLNAARIAVLQRDPEAWRAALTPAIDGLAARFDAADPSVAAMLARLRAMREIDLAPAVPSLARSVDALAAAPSAPSLTPPPAALPWAPPADTTPLSPETTAPAAETAL